ncbi:MAG: alpha/beta fold hydrolase [Mycobacteriales bacterium]
MTRESSAVAARLELDDGRTLAWAEYGEPSGRPIMLQHGTPGSLLSGLFLHEAARSRGWRVIAIERAGMGASSPNPASTATSAATDAAALIDALGLGPVVSMGISGGATPAVGLAVLRPDLVRGAVLVAGMLPMGDGFAEGVPRAMRLSSRATDAASADRAGFLRGRTEGGGRGLRPYARKGLPWARRPCRHGSPWPPHGAGASASDGSGLRGYGPRAAVPACGR